jgi:hypothetical protein
MMPPFGQIVSLLLSSKCTAVSYLTRSATKLVRKRLTARSSLSLARIPGMAADPKGTGARVDDLFMSLIHSAELNKINPFDYLVALLRYHVLVEENPEEWMPWNDAATLAPLGMEG